jgi:hypothetical protein
MNYRTLILVGTIALALVSTLFANDWITAPSYYTHDPQTGERVRQYTPIGPFYTYAQSDYRKSGYRHTRSSLQVGQSADHLHVVEEWGDPVRPYGEWRFPYRPYSVPYPLWGPPYAGAWYGGFGYGYPYHGNVHPSHPSHPGHGPHAPGRFPQGYRPGDGYGLPRPWHDGSYAPYRTPRRSDREFFQQPGVRPHHTPHPKPQPPGGGGN